jgi:hypothetical protein
MARKTVLILATVGVSLLLLVTVKGATASAIYNPTPFPGTVTCNTASGVWNGAISFSPALFNGGTAASETMIIKATLGNSASPCITTSGIVVTGVISGKLQFNISGSANNCATIFSGVALPAPVAASQIKIQWTTPAGGSPTVWKQPSNFSVTGAAGLNKITIKHGTVTGSFAPFANPKAVLSDTGWPTAVASGCGSSTGLSNLSLGTSSGKW